MLRRNLCTASALERIKRQQTLCGELQIHVNCFGPLAVVSRCNKSHPLRLTPPQTSFRYALYKIERWSAE